MALKNPLAYYTPGIPGRGAGTILKQPDLSGYAARQMKLTDLKLKQKQDEDKKVRDDIAELMNLKGTIDSEIRQEGKDKVDYFFNEAQKEISKVEGNWGKADMSRLTRLKWETENFLAQGTIIGKEHDETSKKWVAMEASGLYDDDILAQQKQYIIDESKKPLMERNYPAILSISKLYDFDKKTTDKTKGVGVFQDGRISKPILDDETGLYVSTGTKVSGVSTPEVMEQIKSSMITDPKYAKNFVANYEKMKGRVVNHRYVTYNKTNGRADVEQKQVTITTPEQYMEFEAGKRSYVKYTPVVNAQSKSGFGITINQPQQQNGVTPYQNYTYDFKLPSGNKASGSYVAIKSSTNLFSKDVATQTPYQFTNNAFSFSGGQVRSGQNYFIDNAAGDLLPVTTKNITYKGIPIPAGTPIGSVGNKLNAEEFVNDPTLRGSWKWVGYYNATAKDPNTQDIITGVYEKVSDAPTLANYFRGLVPYKGSNYNWVDYMRIWENDVNAEWGNTETAAPSNTGAGSKPQQNNNSGSKYKGLPKDGKF